MPNVSCVVRDSLHCLPMIEPKSPTSVPSERYSVRRYEARDRAAVRDVCWQTAFMGQPITYQYSDRDSWVDMYTSWYTDREPDGAWVAVDGRDRVVGYLLSAFDTRKAKNEVAIALRHSLTRFLWLRPGTAGFFWRAAWDSLRDIGKPKRPTLDLERYPAHMHCNLLSEARGQGVAALLFDQFHAELRARGVPGIHGEAFASNGVIHGLLGKLGYVPYGEPYPLQGLRAPDGSRLHGQVVLRSLV